VPPNLLVFVKFGLLLFLERYYLHQLYPFRSIMFDMLKIMGRIKEVQQKVKDTQAQLERRTVTAEAGGGLVKATVNGARQVVKLEVDASLLKPEDQHMVQDLSVAAVNMAMKEIDELVKTELKNATSGMIPPIPGLDLSALGL
jgi:nucleoid-associated protein EbfC